jgi:hypothetical protein
VSAITWSLRLFTVPVRRATPASTSTWMSLSDSAVSSPMRFDRRLDLVVLLIDPLRLAGRHDLDVVHDPLDAETLRASAAAVRAPWENPRCRTGSRRRRACRR